MTKILLLDDSKFLRKATERALLRAGYEATTAGGWDAGNRVGAKGAAGFDSAGHAPAKDDWIGHIEGVEERSAD